MTAEEFCKAEGFELQVAEISMKYVRVDLIDHNKSLYKSGKRDGQLQVHFKLLQPTIKKAYARLMDKILDELYH